MRLPTAKLTRRGGVVKVPGIGRLKLMGQVRTSRGTYSLAPLAVVDKNATAGVFSVYTSEDDPTADLSVPMTLEELRASARRVLGGDLPMTEPQRLRPGLSGTAGKPTATRRAASCWPATPPTSSRYR